MTIGYVRVSTDLQDSDNQKFQLLKFANQKGLRIDRWVDETISTRKPLDQRQLGTLINELKAGDTLLISEITRLGRSLFEIMEILHSIMKKGVVLYSMKEGYSLQNDINSKILAFAFGLAGEIERNLISQRTKESLERLKKEKGIKLGRPFGSLNKVTKLTGQEDSIRELLQKDVPVATAARIIGVHRTTLNSFIKSRNIKP
jgi:DNA invertase Pin-like site-specific DNA recombinase